MAPSDSHTQPASSDHLLDMLRSQGMSESDIMKIQERGALIKNASFCSLSYSYISNFFDEKIVDVQAHAEAQRIYRHFAALPEASRTRLGELIWQSQTMRKPSKMGQMVAEARKIAGAEAPFALACMVDTMAMSMAGRSDLLSDKKNMLAIATRHMRSAPASILSSIATRCCYKPDPDLLSMLLDLGARAGSDDHGFSPLAMAARQHGAPNSMTKEKAKALECMRLLLAHGAGVEDQDDRGSTSLGMAASCRFWQACDLLLDHGANPFALFKEAPILDLLLNIEPLKPRALSIQDARALNISSDQQELATAARKPRI
jgi:hypothetical protein